MGKIHEDVATPGNIHKEELPSRETAKYLTEKQDQEEEGGSVGYAAPCSAQRPQE